MIKCPKCNSENCFVSIVGLAQNNVNCYCEACKNKWMILEKQLYSMFECEVCGKKKGKTINNNESLVIKCNKCGHEQIMASKKPHSTEVDWFHEFKWNIDYHVPYNPTQCQRCNSSNLSFLDNNAYYEVRCKDCNAYIWIMKEEYKKQFECPECGSLVGDLQENNSKLGIRCTNCGKVSFYLTKSPDMENRRSSEQELRERREYYEWRMRSIPKCPTCGSTNIQKISDLRKAGGAILFGIFSKDAKSQFECKNCGYKF